MNRFGGNKKIRKRKGMDFGLKRWQSPNIFWLGGRLFM